MDFIRAEKVGHRYQIRDEEGNISRTIQALDGLDLRVASGEFIAVLGANGSGKSTFARHINALLQPTEGTLHVNGLDVSDSANHLAIRQAAGMIFQNPDNQLVAGVVEEDVAFGPENIGVPTEEIEERVTEALDAVGMREYRLHSPNHLSGGQKQRIAIAGVLAMKPKCIVFDESTAMLDPVGRKEVLAAAHERCRRDHLTVIWITHFMEEVTGADRVYVMDAGKIAFSGTPAEVFAREEDLKQYGLELPPVTRIANLLREDGISLPPVVLKREQLTAELLRTADAFGVLSKEDDLQILDAENDDMCQADPWRDRSGGKDGREMAGTDAKAGGAGAKAGDAKIKAGDTGAKVTEGCLLEARNISFVYGADSPYASQALQEVSLQVRKGSFHALIGPTGSGKSTLIQVLGGLCRPQKGTVLLEGSDIYDRSFPKKQLRSRLGLLFQYPEYQLFESTVLKDVSFGPKNMGMDEAQAAEKAKLGLLAAGVSEALWEQSPFELSGGEKRRVAIAGVLAMDPEILIMDEPTAGLDPAGRSSLFALLNDLHRKNNMTILLVSHNMEEVAAYADHITVLQKGTVRLDGTPRSVFPEKERLEEMNLSLPEAAALAQEIRECGLPVRPGTFTLSELRAELRRIYGG